MAFVTSMKTVQVAVPSAVETIVIANITAPSYLLAVTVLPLIAVDDAPNDMRCEIGWTGPGVSQWTSLPFAYIGPYSFWGLEPRVIPVSPDAMPTLLELPTKPCKWGIRYFPGGYTGALRWKAKVQFHMVK